MMTVGLVFYTRFKHTFDEMKILMAKPDFKITEIFLLELSNSYSVKEEFLHSVLLVGLWKFAYFGLIILDYLLGTVIYSIWRSSNQSWIRITTLIYSDCFYQFSRIFP
jgi:hypothetical protein